MTSAFTASPRSTDAVYLPDAEGYDLTQTSSASVFVTNDLDADADVTLEGAAFDDPAVDDPVTFETVTVAAGSTEILSVPWEDLCRYLRIRIDPAAGPTSGDISAKYHTRGD